MFEVLLKGSAFMTTGELEQDSLQRHEINEQLSFIEGLHGDKPVKLLGTGAFSEAFRMSSGDVVVKSSCPVKEVASTGGLPDHWLFPRIDKLGNGLYLMPEYDEFSYHELNGGDRLIYHALDQAYRDHYNTYHSSCVSYSQALRIAFEKIKTPWLRSLMLEAHDGLASIIGESLCFEVPEHNLGLHNGKLVLLDVFFSHDELDKFTDW